MLRQAVWQPNLGKVCNFKGLLLIKIIYFLFCVVKVLHCYSKFNAFLTLFQASTTAMLFNSSVDKL